MNYAEKLKKAGVPVTLHEIPRAMHGYDIAQETPLIKRDHGKTYPVYKKEFVLNHNASQMLHKKLALRGDSDKTICYITYE